MSDVSAETDTAPERRPQPIYSMMGPEPGAVLGTRWWRLSRPPEAEEKEHPGAILSMMGPEPGAILGTGWWSTRIAALRLAASNAFRSRSSRSVPPAGR
jgi:hypothetical protein